MGIVEKLAYKAGRAYETIKELPSIPERTAHEFREGYREGRYPTYNELKKEEEPAYESADEVYERSTGAKKTGDALWDKATGGNKRTKTEPVRTERIKEQKPVVKNYYYGSGARTTKRNSDRASRPPKTSRVVEQPKFNDINNRLINATNRQTQGIDDYNRRIRDMFG
jgi:hypothetical protein